MYAWMDVLLLLRFDRFSQGFVIGGTLVLICVGIAVRVQRADRKLL